MIWRWLLCALVLCALPQTAGACSVCFGDPNSPVAQGVVMGVLALLGVVFVVLGGFVAFFVYLARRASSGAVAAGSTSEASSSDTL
jgi:hypothetical protein